MTNAIQRIWDRMIDGPNAYTMWGDVLLHLIQFDESSQEPEEIPNDQHHPTGGADPGT